ncbi:hypothetical protein NLU13_8385 [Sarocladium strictum]|uniref:Stc1 domain-containing protein n=1 Tax=Sarocladium strictum TaxID=5046 RepID=A0AA39GDX8_SARSR|nr:hypothetical protein NLU13_8385 [Sarocladium strictum]
MTCRQCAEEPESYQCEGECGEMKPAAAFSKVSRRDGTWKCMKCVSWDGLQEAYVPPLEPEHLLKMQLGVDSATALASNYMDEMHPEDSNWAISVAKAASAAGVDITDRSSEAVNTFTSPMPLSAQTRLSATNAFHGKERRDRQWAAMTGMTPMNSNDSGSYSKVSQSGSQHRDGGIDASSTTSFISGSTSQVSESEYPSFGASHAWSVAESNGSHNTQSRWAQHVARGNMMMEN